MSRGSETLMVQLHLRKWIGFERTQIPGFKFSSLLHLCSTQSAACKAIFCLATCNDRSKGKKDESEVTSDYTQRGKRNTTSSTSCARRKKVRGGKEAGENERRELNAKRRNRKKGLNRTHHSRPHHLQEQKENQKRRDKGKFCSNGKGKPEGKEAQQHLTTY